MTNDEKSAAASNLVFFVIRHSGFRHFPPVVLRASRHLVSLDLSSIDFHAQSRALGHGEQAVDRLQRLGQDVVADAAQSDRQRLEDRFARLPTGQVSQGQQVFHSPQAACFSCHSIGYRGGSVGPDLTNIGRIRSPRDLLEAILFPSASFVRSYEPVTVVTHDGRALSGLLESGAADEVVLRSNATQVHRLPNDDVAEIRLGGPSLMPAGMGELLTDQQLADLLAFLASQ